MRTLEEIMNAARLGEKPQYDGLRFAVLALDELWSHDTQALSIVAHNAAGKHCFSPLTPAKAHKVSIARASEALQMPPVKWLGSLRNPDNAAVRNRRRAARGSIDNVKVDFQPRKPT